MKSWMEQLPSSFQRITAQWLPGAGPFGLEGSGFRVNCMQQVVPTGTRFVLERPRASFYRARYYDPSAGRFLGEDNTRFDEGVNFYSYVYNEPTDYSDPWGLRRYKCNVWGVCSKFPFGWKPYRPPPSLNPNSAGLSLVNQQLQAYRDCVASGIKAFPVPPPLPPDPLHGIPKGLYDLKPNAHPMPGDPGGAFAFPDPKPSPIGPPDGLAVVNDLMQRYACWKRGKVADGCGDRFPLAKLSPEF